MKRLNQSLVILIILLFPAQAITQDTITPLHAYISDLGLKFEKMEKKGPWEEKYLLYVPQYIDHHDPSKGSFLQRGICNA